MNIKKIYYLITIVLITFSINNLKAQTYCTGDSILLNALDYTSGNIQWQQSADNSTWSDITGANTLTYMIHPTASMHYRLLITDSLCLPPYPTISKYVYITPNASMAQAGNDQLNLQGTSIVLSANTPGIGSGIWTIVNGTGGSLNIATNPNATFTGTPGIVYTLRWTVSNACSSNFDEINVSFFTFTCGSDITDTRDGQQYPTVAIGSQCWLKKNMNYGQLINTSTAQTNNSIVEKYCYDNITGNCDIYGALYNWDEAMQFTTTESVQGICPAGWHIPSDNEWKILEMALGMSQAEADLSNTWRGTGIGTSLKVGGASGFDAVLGGGLWGAGGTSNYINNMTYLWTSSQSGSNAWRRCLSSGDDKVGRWDSFPKNYGFSVRCVKN